MNKCALSFGDVAQAHPDPRSTARGRPRRRSNLPLARKFLLTTRGLGKRRLFDILARLRRCVLLWCLVFTAAVWRVVGFVGLSRAFSHELSP